MNYCLLDEQNNDLRVTMKNIENNFNEIKVENIRKYYKKNQLLLELQLASYNDYNIYIRLDYFRKLKTYRLSWFDLDDLDIHFIEKNMSFEYISSETIDIIFKILDKGKITHMEYYEEDVEDGEVILELFHSGKVYKYRFNKYIPKKLAFLSNIFIILFNNLPRKLQNFLFELHAELENNVTRYEYKKAFSFDLFNDDINQIFAFPIIERGKKYYEENKVQFLEKIDADRFFSVVEGTEKYLVVIKYNEQDNKMQVYCSCPCEFYCKHIYAVILAIRNKDFNRFYKINYKNPNLSIMDRVLNFDYELCIGIVEKSFEIINHDGEIELIPIFDSSGKCNWQILEDDENMTLARQLQDIVHNE